MYLFVLFKKHSAFVQTESVPHSLWPFVSAVCLFVITGLNREISIEYVMAKPKSGY